MDAIEEERECGECGGTKDILDGVKISSGFDSEGTPVLCPLCAHCFIYLTGEEAHTGDDFGNN